jgi:glutamate-1-semialdehyde aminotransferase
MDARETVADTRRPAIRGRVQDLLASITRRARSDFDGDTDFVQLRLSPVMLVQLRRRIEATAGVAVPTSRLLTDLRSVDALTDYLAGHPRPSAQAATAATSGKRTQKHEAYFRRFVEAYTARTRTSKALAARHRPFFADRRAAYGFRLSNKELVYPIAASRSNGARFWDVDGNEYVDLTMGFGTLLFGHRPAFLIEAVERQLARGVHVGPQSESAGAVAALVTELTGHERATFTVTGTEAVMIALRLARMHSGRSPIAMFSDAYHGLYVGVVMMAEPGPSGDRTVPKAPGIPTSFADDVVMLEYGTQTALDVVAARGHELAAVLVEPVQSAHPGFQPRDFLHELARITRRTGSVLLFDEIITGFRFHQGGAQAWFGVQADLATYGKAAAGGFPIGIVAGRAELLNAVDGGVWQFGDDSFPAADTTWAGGTYIKHPLSMAAAHAVLSRLRAEGGAVQDRINRRTRRLAERLDDVFASAGVPIRIEHGGSMFRFVHRENLDLFFFHLIHEGVYLWEQRLCFLSDAHTDDDVDFVVRAVERSVAALRDAGFLADQRLT